MAVLLAPGELAPARHRRMQRWKYYLLAFVTLAAVAGAQWIFLLDPLVLLFRGVAGIYPAVAGFLGATVIGEKLATPYSGLAFLPVALLIGVLLLTAITPRFYCRYLCPLGAFYGLLSHRPLLRRRVRGCDGCVAAGTDAQCVSGCRMGAVPDRHPTRTQNQECIRCFSGRSFCHTEAIRFDWMAAGLTSKDAVLDLDRRSLVAWGVTGAAVAPLVSLSAYHGSDPNRVVRPPRVLDEGTFVDQCVRCSMCVQACPTQTLQPTHLETGVAGFWTPAITPRVGGCIAACNACSVACPTDAIPEFGKDEADKWRVKMGTAVLETGRCVSYADRLPCGKCLEICPTKAFVIQKPGPNNPKRPVSVIFNRCVGCGLCELACARVVFGTPALITFSRGRGAPTSLVQEPTPLYAPPHRPGE
jgi:ferredoxin